MSISCKGMTDDRQELLAVAGLAQVGLAPVGFALARGECLPVLGPSGAGKTLLLRALADLDPNQGSVRLAGVPREAVSGPAWRRRVMYLAAEPGWWAERVEQHFDDWPAATPLVARLLLPPEIGASPVRLLSTGERQRLALARVLVRAPMVLLLDEPTAALDEAAREAVEGLIGERLSQGIGALWVTHDRNQARRFAGRALNLDRGVATEVRL